VVVGLIGETGDALPVVSLSAALRIRQSVGRQLATATATATEISTVSVSVSAAAAVDYDFGQNERHLQHLSTSLVAHRAHCKTKTKKGGHFEGKAPSFSMLN